MQETHTFFLNLFCAATFCIFVLFGLFLCFFKKQLGTVRDYQKLGGIVLLLLAFHVIFVDYEIFLGSVQYADYVRIAIVAVDFVFVVAFMVRLVMKGMKEEEMTIEDKQTMIKHELLNSRTKTSDSVANISDINAEKAKNDQIETASTESNVITDVNEGIKGEIKDKDISAALATESTEVASVAEVKENIVEEKENNTSVGTVIVEGIDKEVVEEEQIEESEQDTAESVIDETAEEVKEEKVRAEEERPAAAEETNIEDLIFFQKLEFLMAQKKLFCEQDISREQIASAVGTNRTYLTRSIKNATGKTFLEYITDLRTSYAATLLTTTNEPLDIIGTIAGFGSKSAYYRAFSAAYGCSPSEYRKR